MVLWQAKGHRPNLLMLKLRLMPMPSYIEANARAVVEVSNEGHLSYGLHKHARLSLQCPRFCWFDGTSLPM